MFFHQRFIPGLAIASYLKSHGYDTVANVLGGMTAWKAAGLPTVK